MSLFFASMIYETFMKEYEYRAPRGLGLICLGMFGVMTLYGVNNALAHKAVNTRSLTLASESAVYFWWGTSFLFFVLACMGVYIVIKSFGKAKTIRLDDQGITAPPKPISNQLVSINYCDITNLQSHNIGKVRQLIIKSAQTKIVIASNTFDNQADFNDILSFIQSKTDKRF